MNAKEKNQINSRILSLVVSICFICLLLSAPAPAGPTTGQLQQQIDELTAHVNRLRTLIEEPNDKIYTAGVVSISRDYEDCVQGEFGSVICKKKTVIMIDVLEGQKLDFELMRYIEIQEKWELDLEFTIFKSPADNPLTSRDYQVNFNVKYDNETNNFSISPDDPIYSFYHDPSYPETSPFKNLKCELVTDWRVRIIVPGDQKFNLIKTESLGAIDQIHIEPYAESATETELKVHMGNYGALRSNYIVTATGFGPSIEPVIPEYVTLEPYEEPTLTLPIRTVDTFAGQGPCLVTLKSDTGKIYDQTTVDFPAPLPDPPPPEYIPDFDGDGDVDFADYSYFGNYWLEQPDP